MNLATWHGRAEVNLLLFEYALKGKSCRFASMWIACIKKCDELLNLHLYMQVYISSATINLR